MPSVYLPPWRVDVSARDAVRSPLSSRAIAKAAALALEAASAPSPASIAVILSDDRELAALNAEHMGEDGPTDVLSFPLLPVSAFPPHPGSVEPAAPSDELVLPPGRRPHLGDVIVSIERARQQAREGRGGQTGDVAWSVADELRLLVTHGVLHLCGWDHANPVEGDAMRALERKLLTGP